MLLSTQTDITAERLGLEKAAAVLLDAGFDALDLSMFPNPAIEWIFQKDFRPRLEQIRRYTEIRGGRFNQAHAPFPSYRVGDEAYNRRIRPLLLRAIDAAGVVGADNIVIHPVVFCPDDPAENKERNLEMYAFLAPYAAAAGVKIAVENMWGRDGRSGVIRPNVCSTAAQLSEYYDALDPRYFTVCMDVGHIGLVGEKEADFIRALGPERLGCVHIHDTDYVHDLHTCPFTQRLPWGEIAAAFAEIGYRGDLTLEADNFLKPMPDALLPAGNAFLCAAGRELIRQIEAAKAAPAAQ